MPIERLDDPRIAWLAIPISAIGGFVVFALVAAAAGGSAGWSSIVGVVGGVVGILLAVVVLRRTR